MYDKIKELFKKYHQLILYVFFGGLTTLVSWGSYFLLTKLIGVNYKTAQWVSWIAAVAFAFIVNKFYVFADREMTKSGLFRQIWQFVSIRLASGVLEFLLMVLMVEIILIGDSISKIIVSVITVIVNFVASKLLVFNKNDDRDTDYNIKKQKKGR